MKRYGNSFHLHLELLETLALPGSVIPSGGSLAALGLTDLDAATLWNQPETTLVSRRVVKPDDQGLVSPEAASSAPTPVQSSAAAPIQAPSTISPQNGSATAMQSVAQSIQAMSVATAKSAAVAVPQSPVAVDTPAPQPIPSSAFHPLGVAIQQHFTPGKQGGFSLQSVLNTATYVTSAFSPIAAAGLGVAVDGASNTYVVGSFNDGGSNGNQAFLAVYDNSGTQVLFNSFQAFDSQDPTYQTLNTEAHGVAVDQVGNVYVVGQTTDATNGDNDQFLIKFASDATSVVYATAIGGPNQDTGNGVTTEPTPDGTDSNVVFTGTFQDTPGNNNVSLVELDPAGNVAFAFYYPFTGATDGQGNGVALDGAGSAYVAGGINVNGDLDPLMFKLDATTGNPVQAIYVPNPGTDDAFSAVAVDDGGATVNFAGSLGGTSALVGKFNADLAAAPVYFVAFQDVATASGIAADADGTVYFTGSATNPDTATVQAIAVKLDPSGNPTDSIFVGGTGGDTGTAIAFDRNTGNASVVGTTASSDLPVTDGSSLVGTTDAFFANVGSFL